MRRESAIPVAAGAVVVIPFLIAVVEPEEPAKPPTTEVAVSLGRTAGVFETEATPFHIRVLPPGPAPATDEETVVADASGLTPVVVAAVDVNDCKEAPQRMVATSDDTEEWCLSVGEMDGGVEASGAVSNGSDSDPVELSLNLSARHGWGFPVVTALFGLLVAMLLIVWPQRLRDLVKSALLDRARDRNNRVGLKRIEGLDDWISHRLAQGDVTAADVLPTVADVLDHGPSRAKAERKALADKVDSLGPDELPPVSQIYVDARSEANRIAHEMADFVDDEGERVAHPATRLGRSVDLATSYYERQRQLTDRVGAFNSACQRRIRGQLGAVGQGLAELPGLPEAEVEGFARRINDLDIEVTEMEHSGCRTDAATGPRAMERPLDARAVRSASVMPTTSVSTWDSVIDAGWATAITFVVLTSLAIITVMMASYAPKATFGSFADYFTVFAAAVGSSTAATLLTVLLYWRSDEPET
jgi:hypothetical protein